MSNKESITTIAAEETVVTNYSKNILNHLEDSEKSQQEKLDKEAKTFKSGLTCLNQTTNQHSRWTASHYSIEEAPAK